MVELTLLVRLQLSSSMVKYLSRVVRADCWMLVTTMPKVKLCGSRRKG